MAKKRRMATKTKGSLEVTQESGEKEGGEAAARSRQASRQAGKRAAKQSRRSRAARTAPQPAARRDARWLHRSRHRHARLHHEHDAPARRRSVPVSSGTSQTFVSMTLGVQGAEARTEPELWNLYAASASATGADRQAILIEPRAEQQAQHLAIAANARLDSVGFQKSIVERVAGAAAPCGMRLPPNALGNGAQIVARPRFEPPSQIVALRSRQRVRRPCRRARASRCTARAPVRACRPAIRRNSPPIRRRSRPDGSTRARPSQRARTAAGSGWRASREKTDPSSRRSTRA